MILEAILTLSAASFIASAANIFMKNKDYNTKQVSIKKYMPGNLPIMELYHKGHKYNFLIDTGSNMSHIIPSVYKELNCEVHDSNIINTVGIGGKVKQNISCKANFVDELGKTYKIELLVSPGFEQSCKAIESSVDIKLDGLLGTDFLQEYKYNIDFKNLNITY